MRRVKETTMMQKLLFGALLARSFWFAGTPVHAQETALDRSLSPGAETKRRRASLGGSSGPNPAFFACMSQYPPGVMA